MLGFMALDLTVIGDRRLVAQHGAAPTSRRGPRGRCVPRWPRSPRPPGRRGRCARKSRRPPARRLRPGSRARARCRGRPGPRPHDHALVEKRRALHDRALFHAHIVGPEDMAGGLSRKRRRLIAAVHDVAMHLRVFLGRADVDPVAVVRVGDEGLAAFDERGEEAALDRPGGVRRDPIEVEAPARRCRR